MYRKLKVKSTGINWYNRSVIELTGKIYNIVDVEWNALLEFWVLKVRK